MLPTYLFARFLGIGDCNTVQHSTVQYSTVQYSTLRRPIDRIEVIEEIGQVYIGNFN